MYTLPEVWQEAERIWPDMLAVQTPTRGLSYRELAVEIRGVAASIARKWHVAPGDIVALLAPNCVEFVVSYLAITSLGAIVQPIDERLHADEMDFLLQDSGVRNAIVHRSFWHKFSLVKCRVPRLINIAGIDSNEENIERYEEWLDIDRRNHHLPAVDSQDVAELMYTSGTTGRPKGVLRTHRNALAASANARRAFDYRQEDVIAVVMPLSHSSALVSQMLPIFQVGGTMIPIERFDAIELLNAIRVHSVTCLRAVPAMFRLLLACPQFRATEVPSLRLLMNSSAAIDPNTYLEVKGRFPSGELVNSYGLTEASTCSILSDACARTNPDSIGVPISGVEMRIVDANDCELLDGNEGEIQIRGKHVFAGYLGLPTESKAAIAPGGWLRTGDIGHRDQTGLYYFHGRRDDVINCGGRKFAPLEVENCILELSSVSEAAVVAMPHRVLGQVAMAYVVIRPGATQDPRDVSRHCARRLASHMVPFKVEIVVALPRSSVGKVLHRSLRTVRKVCQ